VAVCPQYTTPMDQQSTGIAALTRPLLSRAHDLGFDLAAVVPAAPPTTMSHYRAWIGSGYHGDMAYLARPDAMDRRGDLQRILPGVRSVLAVGTGHPAPLPAELANDPARGIVARYAWQRDYHGEMEERLERLARWIAGELARPLGWRVYVDTGPILERELARQAGLGFIGKHTNLIHPRLGSWLLLGELLLAIDLEPGLSVLGRSADPEGPRQIACGRCTRCLDVCPTRALVAPYVLDARRCISYLTIESKGPIPYDLRPLIGNHIFGCDLCQEVCPWNLRFGQSAPHPPPLADADAMAPRLSELANLDRDGFRRRFDGTSLLRAKRRGLLRNVAVALGNWASPAALHPLALLLRDPEPLIRGHAAWALGRIAAHEGRCLLQEAISAEPEESAKEEMRRSLG
jgi:epoxyqueuosine reductase